MATRDREQTRRQLLDAAFVEFAAHGIAGSRMERIAKIAGCSAGLAYTYYGGKDELFDAVYAEIVDAALDQVPIDAADLPGHAARLYEGQREHPEVMRLATWHQLERAGHRIDTISQAAKSKVDAIRVAQEQGLVSDRFSAEQVLALVLTIASMWSTTSPETFGADGFDHSQRRQTVEDAVRRLVSP